MKLGDLRCKTCGGPPVDLSPEWMAWDVEKAPLCKVGGRTILPNAHDVFAAFKCALGHFTEIKFGPLKS